MDLQHKLRKLFRIDALQSAVEHARRWSHPVDWKGMYHSLDPVRRTLLRERYLDSTRTEIVGNSAKFADAEYWLKINVERAQDLDLDRSTPLRVLDLGCGAGYFLYVCQQLGHEALGLDIDENPLYRETLELLAATRVVWRIEAFALLPKLEGKFDLVTAHCICFQKAPTWQKGNQQEWGAEEWQFFLDDVRTRVLNENGRILLDFNPRRGGVYYPADVEGLFRKEGARLFRSKVLLGKNPECGRS